MLREIESLVVVDQRKRTEGSRSATGSLLWRRPAEHVDVREMRLDKVVE